MSVFYVYGPNRSQLFVRNFVSAGDEVVSSRDAKQTNVGVNQHIFVEYKKFPDEELDMTVFRLHSMTDARVVYFANWSKPAYRYADLACLIAISEMKPRFLTIVIPFFPTGTMEREEHEGSICTANTDAKLLSALPCSQKRVIFVDVHTVTNQFYFHDTVVTNESCMPYFVKNILPSLSVYDSSSPSSPTSPSSSLCGSTVVAFPDEGAQKRFKRYFGNYSMVACSKVRVDGDKRIVTLGEQDQRLVKGKSVLIVDDLVRSGNTLIECAKVLRSAGAVEVCVFVPHAVFPRDEFENFGNTRLFNRFIVTDSIPETTDKMQFPEDGPLKVENRQIAPFEVISLGKILQSIVKP